MPNTQTTQESDASRLTDNEILNLAEQHTRIDSGSLPQFVVDRCRESAAVLRDYVRLRKLVNAIAVSVHDVDLEHMPDDDIDCINELSDVMKELKRLLADAEKGETK